MTCSVVLAAVLAQSSAQASGLDRDERVILYPTAAALAEDGKSWLLPVRFCVFEPELADPLRSAMLRKLRDRLALRDGTPEAERFSARARLFLVDHERRQRVNLAIGKRTFELGPTAPDGCFETVLPFPADLAAELAPEGRLALSIGAEGDPTGARGAVLLVPNEGRSVISDIDDTIKVTGVGDSRAALANTFLHEFKTVAGMAELYARLAEPGAAFHYVSLSPWQLAPLLEEFLVRERFPAGSIHLQRFRMADGELGDLVGDSREKKLAAIVPLLATWPKRRFVLVGDASQRDPEVYAEIARRHADQIELILIRDPSGAAPDSTRFTAAFEGVPRQKWQLFEDPAKVELPVR